MSAVAEWISGRVFRFVHQRNLVYNTCWEDPRLDRIALRLGGDDVILMITSAGCNALDYVLQSPKHIHAVDLNPRQNALLELKIAAIRAFDYETFFDWFGRGRSGAARDQYERHLREQLSDSAREYWDNKIRFFGGRRPLQSFYFRGTAGQFARIINHYIDRVAKIRGPITELLEAKSLEEQQRLYDQFRDLFWRRMMRWFVGRDSTLSLIGVPRPQRLQVERHYEGGIAKFIEDCVESVFAKLPIADNYFWRVYLTGEYTPTCRPEYLGRENFEALKGGLVDRISTHTTSILDFLSDHEVEVSRYVLLDHMDWLAVENREVLAAEWQAICDRAASGARVIYRSGGLNVDYVDDLVVTRGGAPVQVGELLTYDRDLAEELHQKDRVHTYGSFYIADLASA